MNNELGDMIGETIESTCTTDDSIVFIMESGLVFTLKLKGEPIHVPVKVEVLIEEER